jgi:simple sugar transport system ATP-binding protein
MRKGTLVSTGPMPSDRERATKELADAIMGGDAPAPIERAPIAHGATVLRARALTLGRALRGVSFEARAGEVVGIAGVEGNGQRELVRVLAGLDAPDAGELLAPAVAVVHEDRHKEGLVLDASVRDNLLLGELPRFSRGGVLDLAAMDAEARAAIARALVTPPDPSLPVRALSGGNQQKVVVIRAALRTERGARALVVAHPTRGVDIGAARAIHRELLDAASRGCAVVVVSADLSELRALCDRILVLARGRIVAELPPSSSDRAIGDAMLGASHAP